MHVSCNCIDSTSQRIHNSFNYTDESLNSTQGNNRYQFWESYLVRKYALRGWSVSPNIEESDIDKHSAEIRANLPEEWHCLIIWYPHSCPKASILSLWSRNLLNALCNYSFYVWITDTKRLMLILEMKNVYCENLIKNNQSLWLKCLFVSSVKETDTLCKGPNSIQNHSILVKKNRCVSSSELSGFPAEKTVYRDFFSYWIKSCIIWENFVFVDNKWNCCEEICALQLAFHIWW